MPLMQSRSSALKAIGSWNPNTLDIGSAVASSVAASDDVADDIADGADVVMVMLQAPTTPEFLRHTSDPCGGSAYQVFVAFAGI